MLKIEASASLKAYNTFGIDATAEWLIHYESVEDLQKLISDEYFQECRYLHIGEGSNLLFLANFRGIILRSELKTLEVVCSDEKSIQLLVGSGWNWDEFVAYATQAGYYGAENLSLIPGQIGSAAIQNIGAYGIEIERLIVAVHTLHRRTGEVRIFSHAECKYAYRHSIFKEAEYSDYIVTHVRLELSREPKLNLSYADLQRYFQEQAIEPTPQSLREAIIAIRQAKLPSPQELGNAGSFFMNPIVEQSIAEGLKAEYPDLPTYPLHDGKVKLAAGWLIDRCGFKGYRDERAGVYEKQALVLINLGGATGQDIANLALKIQGAVKDKFGIEIQPEVRYIS